MPQQVKEKKAAGTDIEAMFPLLEGMETPVLLLDAEGRILRRNESYLRTLNLPLPERAGFSFFGAGLLSTERMKVLLRDGRVSVHVLYNRLTDTFLSACPDRPLRNNLYLGLFFSVIRKDLDIAGFVLEFRDETRDFNSRLEDREMRTLLRAESELGKQVFWMYRVDTEEWYISGEVRHSLEDYIREMSDHDRDVVVDQWGRTLADPEGREVFEHTYALSLGKSTVYHSLRWQMIRLGGIRLVFGLIADVTEMMRTESALRERAVHMELLANLQDVVFWNYDLKRHCLSVCYEELSESVLSGVSSSFYSMSFEEISRAVGAEGTAAMLEQWSLLQQGKVSMARFRLQLQAGDREYRGEAAFIVRDSDRQGNPQTLFGLFRLDGSFRAALPGDCGKPAERKKILVAEDVDNNFDLFLIVFRNDYEIVRAFNGLEAVRLFSECRPDLVLMDLKMPEMGGLDAARLIRMESPDVPIIAVTAYLFDSDLEMSREAGCNELIFKPIDISSLKMTVKRYLEGGKTAAE